MEADSAATRGGNMKRLILLIAVMALAGISSLSALPTAASANPIGQASVIVPPVNVRILHTWKQAQGGTLRDYRDESLGTIIAPDLILTHSHYSRPQATWLEEAYLFEDEWGRSVRWQPRSLQLTVLNAGTMLIRLPAGAFPDRATVADRTNVARLTVGTWLTISYWDDVAGKIVQRDFQITQLKNGIAKLADPNKYINHGDSGGGAFAQNQLIGNIWSIDVDGSGNILGQFNVALVPPRTAQP
jgi:hypothetical protein